MPPLRDHQSSVTTKLLLVGEHGSGKTGALASLAQAGYNLRIIDVDNGIDVLSNLLRAKNSPYGVDALARVEYETLTDSRRNQGGRLVPGRATVWQRLVGLLTNWKTETADFGSITTWTTKDILVIDTLRFAARAALQFVLAMNARLGQKPFQSDYGDAQELVIQLLETLADESVKSNVIVNTHIKYLGDDNGPLTGFPMTVGKALDSQVGGYFNTVLLARATGKGDQLKQKIITKTAAAGLGAGVIALKNTAPLSVRAEYDLSSGLAEYFKAVRADTGTGE
jgi:AAA domain